MSLSDGTATQPLSGSFTDAPLYDTVDAAGHTSDDGDADGAREQGTDQARQPSGSSLLVDLLLVALASPAAGSSAVEQAVDSAQIATIDVAACANLNLVTRLTPSESPTYLGMIKPPPGPVVKQRGRLFDEQPTA